MLLWLACAQAPSSPPAPGGAADSPPRPNVVVIVTDDLGYADAGFQGSERVRTPNLDAMADGGVLFESGYVTHPYCSPSRAGLLTGRYQQRFGYENNPAYDPTDTSLGLPVGELTLGDALRGVGYRTGYVGKWHLGAAPRFHPQERGFDEFFGFLGGGHEYFARVTQNLDAEYTGSLERNGERVASDGYLTDHLTREAVAFVRRARDSPFLLVVSYNAPHTPYQAPAERCEGVTPGSSACRTYRAMVEAVDDGVGDLRAVLRELGIANETLLFFLSDNGGQTLFECADNAPLRGRKARLFEGGVRVPFLAEWTGRLPAALRYRPPVSSLDVFATAAALAGVSEMPHPLDGRNLVPLLSQSGAQAASPPPRALFWRTGGGDRWAVREGRWKLHGPEPRLYDLEADVGESRELSAANPAVVNRLRDAYAQWNEQLIEPLWPNPPAEDVTALMSPSCPAR